MQAAMLSAVILFGVFSQAHLEVQTTEDQVHISRNSRSNPDPITTNIVYNKAGEGPATMTFDNTYRKPTEKYTEFTTNTSMDKIIAIAKNNTTDGQESWKRINDKEVYLPSKLNDEQVKAKTKWLQLSANDTSGDMNIRSINEFDVDFNANAVKEMFIPYVPYKEFRIDNEDIRTDSRNTYNGWPYSYNGPYDYEVKKPNVKNEKAKDKRFLSTPTTEAPVNRNVADTNPMGYISNEASSKDSVVDNPIYGDQPFLSFVLTDYFDRNHEEDPLIFKDFTWGEEFDNGLPSQDTENNDRQSRRLHISKDPNEIQSMDTSEIYTKTTDKELVTEKTFDSNRGYEKHGIGDNKNDQQGSKHNHEGSRKTAFKDFADSFANKFGSEKHNKNSKFMLKTNQDKSQKRRGFKKVYHKDEYQEDNEFYDNANKSFQAEDNGGSNFNIGASKSFLQSQAVGSTGVGTNSLNNKDDKKFENDYESNDRGNEGDGEINRYRSIAKDAALSNNADYTDNFRI